VLWKEGQEMRVHVDNAHPDGARAQYAAPGFRGRPIPERRLRRAVRSTSRWRGSGSGRRPVF
jgi:hypothetical protein